MADYHFFTQKENFPVAQQNFSILQPVDLRLCEYNFLFL